MAAKTKPTAAVLANLKGSGLDERDAQVLRLRCRSAEETLAFTKGKYGVESYGFPYFEGGTKVNGFERVRFVGTPIGLDAMRGKAPRYWQNDQGCRLYLPPYVRWQKVMKDPSVTIVFTEGEKKSAKACKEGIAAIGLGGVDNLAREALDELDAFEWKDRKVEIAFDAPDSTKNMNVVRAIRRVSEELTRRGATVSAKHLPELRPGEKTGLDDFLVARGAKAYQELALSEVDPPQRPTDAGNAHRLLARHGSDMRYAAAAGWLAWDGVRWRAGDAEVMRRAKDTAASIYAEAAREKDDARRQATARWAATSESVTRIEAMVKLARTEPGVEIGMEALDADPWLLGVANGVVDLRTGKLRPARREDFVTKHAAVAFDPHAKCPTLDKFMHRVMAGDAQVIAFLRRGVGYSLTGDTLEKCLFFLYGATGDNGKSTFLEFLQTLLGDYARKVSAEMLMAKRFSNPGAARPDIVALYGRRLVVASELSDVQRFDESFLKDMVGGIDRVEARGLYNKEGINFKPSFKLWLYGNYRPQLRSDDDAAWRRLYLVPFDVRIPKAEQDRELYSKLVAELPGILNWALAGLADYLRAGMRPPAKVLAATADYREEQDWFGRFLGDCFAEDARAKGVALKGVFGEHIEWCKAANLRPMSEPRFRDALKAKGFAIKAGHANKRFVMGLRIKMAADDARGSRWGTDDDNR